MTVLADFKMIVDDSGQIIPTASGSAEVALGNGSFNTGGRLSNETAFLIYSLRDMVGTAQVFVNRTDGPDEFVGTITPSSGTAWSTQLIAMGGSELIDGNNRIILKNVTDSFRIKDVICFYHQDSD